MSKEKSPLPSPSKFTKQGSDDKLNSEVQSPKFPAQNSQKAIAIQKQMTHTQQVAVNQEKNAILK